MTYSTTATFIAYNTATKVFTFTPKVADLGEWTVAFTIVDTASNSASYFFKVYVNNLPPQYTDPTVSYSSFSMPLNS